ncbi:DUF4382 domain-containing protein, partial [Candidatus Woesearchaeota archaeon]|nr:DUF4382 domain-containing protein [Candidatus Woesearchaeota archaeon]
PGQLFYGMDKFMERVRLAFTVSNIKKAKLHVKYAEERLAELEEVVKKNKTKYIAKLIEEHEEELEEAQEEIDKAAAKGKSVEEIAAHVAVMTYKHIEVLNRVLAQVPEQAKPHIEHAISVSIKGNEQAVQSIEKETGKPADVPKAKERPEKPEKPPEEEEEGELVMQITDKPGDIDITKLEITFSSVMVHTSSTATPQNEVCKEESYQELGCRNETVLTDENCTNITEIQEVCANETFYNESCTEDECVNGTFVKEEVCVNGTLINDSCVNGTFVDEIICVNGTFVPAGCTNESYVEEICTNETVVINQTCTGNTTVEEVCENATQTRTVCTVEGGEGNAGWKTIIDEAKTFDLIAIKDIKEFLGETELAAGKYTQIRLLISGVNLEVDGEPASLKVPSNKIKLIHPFTIVGGETTTLTLDFDADKSVHQAGDKYILKPTIKVIQE